METLAKQYTITTANTYAHTYVLSVSLLMFVAKAIARMGTINLSHITHTGEPGGFSFALWRQKQVFYFLKIISSRNLQY